MSEEPPNRIRISLRLQPRYIYALIDPRDNIVRYVGVTKNVYSRLKEHTKSSSKKDDKGEWIAELDKLGLSPELEILETINVEPGEVESDIDVIALEREKYWINRFLELGVPLLNIMGITRIRPVRIRPPRTHQPRQDFNPSTPFGEARMRTGLTIDQLSAEANISQWIIRKIEHDKPVSGPLAGRACKILSRYLGYPVTYRDLGIKIV